jgi:hypothetical protein
MADPTNDKGDIKALIGIDPYVPWVMGPGRRYFFLPGRQPPGEERMPLLVRLKTGTAQEFANGAHLPDLAKDDWRNSVSVSPLFTRSPAGRDAAPYLVAMVRASYLSTIVSDEALQTSLRDTVENITPGLPLDAASLPPPGDSGASAVVPEQTISATPQTVVMAVIDDGIAFAHERFRKIVAGYPKTRIEYWWLQDGPYAGSTSTVLSGCELRKPEIDKLIADCTTGGAIDEDLLYRKAGLLDFRQYGHKSAAWHAAHGTAVMDLACGCNSDPPVDDRPIIAVQLPVRVTADTSGASLYLWVVAAMAYIRDRATVLSGGPSAPQLPVVVNLSYGRLEGPHDGTSDIELAMERFIQQSAARGVRLSVVLPAGNSYLLRTHAQVEFRHRNQRELLRWRVLPDDRTPSFSEIWLPPRHAGSPSDRIELAITSPTGQRRTISETSGPVQWDAGGGIYGQALYAIAQPSNRGMFRISLTPTAYSDDPSAPLSPAGLWELEVKNVGEALIGQVVHAWIQRDDTLYGFPLRGRQSFFDDPRYVRFDHAGRENETDNAASPVRRASTINSMATDKSPIVAGGYRLKEMAAAKYSAAGAGLSPPRHPDALAVSDDSCVLAGVLAAGTFSGSVAAMDGTSVAAPQIARLVADDIAAGGTGGRGAIYNRATADEMHYPPGTPPKPLPERGGAGRLKPHVAFRVRR